MVLTVLVRITPHSARSRPRVVTEKKETFNTTCLFCLNSSNFSFQLRQLVADAASPDLHEDFRLIKKVTNSLRYELLTHSWQSLKNFGL